MMGKIVCILLAILAVCITESRAFECYKCDSSISWDDCKKKTTKVSCPGSSMCFKGVKTCIAGNAKETHYFKRCNDIGGTCSAKTGESPTCTSTSPFSWSVSTTSTCCSSSLCNAGSYVGMNKFLVSLCVTLAMFVLMI